MLLGSSPLAEVPFGADSSPSGAIVSATILTAVASIGAALLNSEEIDVGAISAEATLPTAFLQVVRLPPPIFWLSSELLFPGYSSDGVSITIPISSLPGLSAAEADSITGDWREIMQAILTRSHDYSRIYVNTLYEDQYRTYKIHKQELYNSTIDSYFQVKFLTDMGEPNVAPEP